TSMATPHVSGVAALLISAGVASTPDEVREALQSTAEDKGLDGWDSEYGWGIVDAYAALQWEPPLNPPALIAEAAGPYIGTGDAAIDFTGSASGGTPPYSYDWDFGDSTSSNQQNPIHTYTTAGTYTATLTVTDINGENVQDTAQVEITETFTLPTMHIDSIEMTKTLRKLNGWYNYATATVTIVDANNEPIDGVTVNGYWSGVTIGLDSGDTVYSGTVTFDSDIVRKTRDEFTFTVDSISKDGYTYNPNENIEFIDSI
ncbi:MAG: serine protease, partial [Candidatus Methanocomedens sp.]